MKPLKSGIHSHKTFGSFLCTAHPLANQFRNNVLQSTVHFNTASFSSTPFQLTTESEPSKSSGVESGQDNKNGTQKRTKPFGYWRDIRHQRNFMDQLGKKLGFQSYEDWYKVKGSDITENGGTGFLGRYYRFSPSKAVMTIYPEHNWDIFRFHASFGFWKDKVHQRKFMEALAKKLGIETMDDWYKVSRSDILSNGGGRLLGIYDNSPSTLIMNVFKEHEWDTWRFHNLPRNYWKHPSNQQDFLRRLMKKKNIGMDGLYKVTKADIVSASGSGYLKYFDDSIAQAITHTFPEHQWDEWKFARPIVKEFFFASNKHLPKS